MKTLFFSLLLVAGLCALPARTQAQTTVMVESGGGSDYVNTGTFAADGTAEVFLVNESKSSAVNALVNQITSSSVKASGAEGLLISVSGSVEVSFFVEFIKESKLYELSKGDEVILQSTSIGEIKKELKAQLNSIL
jgi:hypothetical protein